MKMEYSLGVLVPMLLVIGCWPLGATFIYKQHIGVRGIIPSHQVYLISTKESRYYRGLLIMVGSCDVDTKRPVMYCDGCLNWSLVTFNLKFESEFESISLLNANGCFVSLMADSNMVRQAFWQMGCFD